MRNFIIKPASDIRAASGIPDIGQAPSANAGQSIGVSVPFDPATAWATFNVIDFGGNKTTRDVQSTVTDAARGVAYFQVPYDAITGDTVVFSKVGTTKIFFADGTFYLQIVPVVVVD